MNKIAQVNKEEREIADRRNWPQDGSVSEESPDAWTSLKNSFSEYWSNVKVNTAAGWEDFKSDIGYRIENTKNSFINYGNAFKNAFSSWDGLKNVSLGVSSSIANGGLNTARIILTFMSCQPNNTWNQLGSSIDWTNEKIQTNLVTDQNTYQTFSTIADAGQMAWGAGGLYKMFKGGIGLPSFSNSSSFMDVGTGMRISGVPDDFGRMNVSPINGVDRGTAGVNETKIASTAVKEVKPYDITTYNPKNSPLENHHGIMDAWAAENVPGYVSRAPGSPTMALTKEAHNATKSEFMKWKYETYGSTTAKVDWKNISPQQIQSLSDRMFNAAKAPTDAASEYYQAFNKYIYNLK